jgi:hypothetical protein
MPASGDIEFDLWRYANVMAQRVLHKAPLLGLGFQETTSDYDVLDFCGAI